MHVLPELPECRRHKLSQASRSVCLSRSLPIACSISMSTLIFYLSQYSSDLKFLYLDVDERSPEVARPLKARTRQTQSETRSAGSSLFLPISRSKAICIITHSVQHPQSNLSASELDAHTVSSPTFRLPAVQAPEIKPSTSAAPHVCFFLGWQQQSFRRTEFLSLQTSS